MSSQRIRATVVAIFVLLLGVHPTMDDLPLLGNLFASKLRCSSVLTKPRSVTKSSPQNDCVMCRVSCQSCRKLLRSSSMHAARYLCRPRMMKPAYNHMTANVIRQEQTIDSNQRSNVVCVSQSKLSVLKERYYL